MKNFQWKKLLDISVASLLIIGGLNSGLIGLFHVDHKKESQGSWNSHRLTFLSHVWHSSHFIS